jgi:hypothetical protein
MRLTIGIDVGQQADPTAIAVTELQWRGAPQVGKAAPKVWGHHVVRHLERLDLGTPYDKIVERLVAIVTSVHERVTEINRIGGYTLGDKEYADMLVYLDATGVGKPVADLMKAAGVPVMPVYFTHGDRRNLLRNEMTRQQYVHLGKAYLVSRLQVLLQYNRIHLPRTQEAVVLARELRDYEIKVDKDANDKYGAFKVGTHDDLVTALGLSAQDEPEQTSAPASSAASAPMVLPSWSQKPVAIQRDRALAPDRALDRLHGGQRFGVLSDWGPDLQPPEKRRREGWTP